MYYVNLLCRFCNSSSVDCIMFLQKKFKNQANLRWLGLDPHRLACVIYEGQLGHRRLTCDIHDDPAQSS
jgi:hypothetical protein